MRELEAARVPCGEMLSLQGVLDDPHVNAMEFMKDVKVPGIEQPVRMMDLPIRFSRSVAGIRNPPAALGEHSDQILSELGLDPERIAALRANSTI